MQQNINPYYNQNPIQQIPATTGPNAVNINIIQPQAYGCANAQGTQSQGYYPLYQANQNPNLPLYPMNYNNMIHYPAASNPIDGSSQNQKEKNSTNAFSETNLLSKTDTPIETTQKESVSETKKEEKEKKPKKITILTDDYIKSLENYLNDSNPKVRLIAAKEVMERFKEDDSRLDNPSLSALLNKMLRDTSPSVRFLGLTTLQLGYSIGNDETIGILKEIQANNQDKLTQDSLLASEILLKLSAPKVTEVK